MINEKYHYIWNGDRLVVIRFYTDFLDDVNDLITYYLYAENGMFTDDGYTRDELSTHTDDEKLIDKVMEYACQRYGCEMVGDEMQSDTPERLLQAMMAVYAWIEFRECGL